jgi:Membrane proteins related to metalloendopeptidases
MPGQTPETPACEGFMHTVRAGDTLYMLARQYQITLDALMKANPSLDPYNLRIGMQLCIPFPSSSGTMNIDRSTSQNVSGGTARSNGKFYTTQRGDTLTRILDRYEITFAALQSSNPTINFTQSLEDKELIIPSEDHYRTCPMSGAYIVKSGDSLDSISKKLLVLTDNLIINNPTLTVDDFSIPGTKVCIPN